MIALWLLYAVLVGGLLALAGRVLEAGARLLGLPLRWIWVGVLLALIALITRPLLRVEARWPPDAAGAEAAAALSVTAGNDGSRATLVGTARAALDVPLRVAVAATAAETRRSIGVAFVACWSVATLTLLALFWATLRRSRRARRGWPVRDLDGVRVRVAPNAGPAVVGLLRPDIVLPVWLLDASAATRRLVLAHEGEHVRARDHALLAFATLAVALLPWHPAVWWIARRLRLAVELDCDARVLKAGAPVAAYGSLLVEMAGRSAPLTYAAPALAEAPSDLERRLLAMTRRIPRFAPVRGGALVACAALLVMAACETALPTAAELDAMDVAAAERHAAALGLVGAEAPTIYVDGELVNEATAHALPADRVQRIEMVRAALDATAEAAIAAPPTVHITTTAEASRAARVRALAEEAERQDAAAAADAAQPGTLRIESARTFTGILLIDGRRVDPRELRRIVPEAIESIEIVKGPAATRLFSDRAAENGVIRIRTKAGAPR